MSEIKLQRIDPEGMYAIEGKDLILLKSALMILKGLDKAICQGTPRLMLDAWKAAFMKDGWSE